MQSCSSVSNDSCTGAQALQNAAFGQGNDPILLDNVVCTGSESHLANCSHRGIGIHSCNHFEDAGVRCIGEYAIKLYCVHYGIRNC